MDNAGRKIILTQKGLSAKEVIRLASKALKNEQETGIIYAAAPDLSMCSTRDNCDAYYLAAVLICVLLKINCPNIDFVEKLQNYKGITFNTDTGLSTGIVIRTDSECSVIKDVAHELRHVWQHAYHNDYYFKTYNFNLTGEQYYLQEAEIDANGFALAILHQLAGMKYTLPLTPYEKVNQEIKIRAKEIVRSTPHIKEIFPVFVD